MKIRFVKLYRVRITLIREDEKFIIPTLNKATRWLFTNAYTDNNECDDANYKIFRIITVQLIITIIYPSNKLNYFQSYHIITYLW